MPTTGWNKFAGNHGVVPRSRGPITTVTGVSRGYCNGAAEVETTEVYGSPPWWDDDERRGCRTGRVLYERSRMVEMELITFDGLPHRLYSV
jgi:hypothetical protein